MGGKSRKNGFLGQLLTLSILVPLPITNHHLTSFLTFFIRWKFKFNDELKIRFFSANSSKSSLTCVGLGSVNLTIAKCSGNRNCTSKRRKEDLKTDKKKSALLNKPPQSLLISNSLFFKATKQFNISSKRISTLTHNLTNFLPPFLSPFNFSV